MSMYWILILGIWWFQVLPHHFSAAEKICGDEHYMKEVCARIRRDFLLYGDTEEEIKRNSKCINNVPVQKGDRKELQTVGLCVLGPDHTKCILNNDENDLKVCIYHEGICIPDENIKNYLVEPWGGIGGSILSVFNVFHRWEIQIISE